MNTNTDRLRSLLDQIRNISLFDRIFQWKRIRNQLIDVSAEIQKLNSFGEYARELQASNSDLKKDLDQANNLLQRLSAQTGADAERIRKMSDDNRLLFEDNSRLRHNDEQRRQEHISQLDTLNSIREQLIRERQTEIADRHAEEHERLRKMKDTWLHHEQLVRSTVRSVCSKHHIEFVEKVPFKGEPDNAIRICGEFVIFDAKSPAGEDLKNFPLYLRDQAEKVKKYVREEGVRREIFLVVPSNVLEAITTYLYKLADYTVYIISPEALEPLILCLQRLEDYEFAAQLSPEERDNICRVIGKFAHLTKRRIQIDTFFIRQFMELAYKSESDLPADILEKSIEFEKAEKLNPPSERRSKQINMKDLERETSRLTSETSAKGIPLVEDLATEINKLPLYDAL